MKQISEDLYLDQDELNIILREKKVRKTGKKAGEPVFNAIGYYANYEQVCKALNDIGMRKYIDNDWLDCVQFVEGAYDKMIEIMKDNKNTH